VFDEGKAQPRVEYFKRAEAHFTQAMATAQAAGTVSANVYLAALAGRANVKAWQGNWDGAVQDAALVPPGFSYQALYSSNTAREENPYFFHTWRQWYGTGANTPWLTAGDPRVTFTPALDAKGGVIKTRDGRWPGINQNRYLSLDAEMDIVTGREMLLIRAEAALRKKDIAGATALMNASRATYNMATLKPLAVPATEAEAWKTLIFERGATMYLEGRRFWDLTRWYKEGLDQQMKGRELCWPISQQEMDSNPNLVGFTGL
jgi:starch-binding outer membrane protein, SusD/RagB family